MQPFSRIVAVLLLGMAGATLGLPALALPGNLPHAAQPAGCHHGPKTPASAPAPVSYQCCAAGHNASMPGSGFAVSPLVMTGPAAVLAPAACAAAVPPALTSTPLCHGSPGLSPLRI